jgi:hypothetical protein
VAVAAAAVAAGIQKTTDCCCASTLPSPWSCKCIPTLHQADMNRHELSTRRAAEATHVLPLWLPLLTHPYMPCCPAHSHQPSQERAQHHRCCCRQQYAVRLHRWQCVPAHLHQHPATTAQQQHSQDPAAPSKKAGRQTPHPHLNNVSRSANT